MPNLTQRRKRSAQKQRRGFVEFPAGTELLHRDRPCRCFYLLVSGKARLAADSVAIIDYLSRGDFFGEKCLLRNDRGSLTAKALSPVELCAFGKSELLDHLQQNRRFAARLLSSFARRLDRYEQTIREAVTEGTERRLALLLGRFLPARPATGWVPLLFSPSNSELARSIGSTRWRVAHFMGRFQRLGWLQRRPELWVSREGLQEFLKAAATHVH